MLNEQTIIDIEISKWNQINSYEIWRSTLEDSLLSTIWDEPIYEWEGDR